MISRVMAFKITSIGHLRGWRITRQKEDQVYRGCRQMKTISVAWLVGGRLYLVFDLTRCGELMNRCPRFPLVVGADMSYLVQWETEVDYSS